MDKYEFRGRSKQTGRWLFGDLIRIDRCVFIAPFDVFWRDFIDCRETNPIHTPYDVYEVFPSTVGQFTGITDKDGIKIYEGDIVECVSWNDFFTNPDTGEVMEPFRRKVYIELRNGGFKMIEKMPITQILLKLKRNHFIYNPNILNVNKSQDCQKMNL